MDTTQLMLTVVLSVTTILLIIIGVQLIFVLRDIRRLLKRTNTIIEGFEKVGVSFEHGMGEIQGFVTGFKTLYKIIDVVHSKKHEK